MANSARCGPWIRRFLLEHLVRERNLARNTQCSYRDTLALLMTFIAARAHKPIDQLDVVDVSAENVREFLQHLEQVRRCNLSTRNQRLAVIHALARFIGERSPEHIEWSGQIRAIPFKKGPKRSISYLEKSEMDALLAAPDRCGAQGIRDYALLLFLYNTGARADEAAQLRIGDLQLSQVPHREQSFVKLRGKGNKLRLCPLWPNTADRLKELIETRDATESVFLNRCGRSITRFGIHGMVERYAKRVSARIPDLLKKRVSPHSVRHTSATHLLRGGVDINTVRAWLGHVSVDTTSIYAETDLETKAKALAHCEIKDTRHRKRWRDDTGLMTFLRHL
jgi:site-specific recombinase XerD